MNNDYTECDAQCLWEHVCIHEAQFGTRTAYCYWVIRGFTGVRVRIKVRVRTNGPSDYRALGQLTEILMTHDLILSVSIIRQLIFIRILLPSSVKFSSYKPSSTTLCA